MFIGVFKRAFNQHDGYQHSTRMFAQYQYSVDNLGCLQERCSVEEARNVQLPEPS